MVDVLYEHQIEGGTPGDPRSCCRVCNKQINRTCLVQKSCRDGGEEEGKIACSKLNVEADVL